MRLRYCAVLYYTVLYCTVLYCTCSSMVNLLLTSRLYTSDCSSQKKMCPMTRLLVNARLSRKRDKAESMWLSNLSCWHSCSMYRASSSSESSSRQCTAKARTFGSKKRRSDRRREGGIERKKKNKKKNNIFQKIHKK